MNNRSHGNGKSARIGRKHAIVVLSLALIAILALTSNSSATGNFTPTITFETSTTRATAHPDARITIDNTSSSEDLRDLTIDLPKGFLGSLNAADKCSVTDTNNAACTDDSLVGTVINDATVDNSDVRLRGKIFLTEPLNSTDPAGLQIVVPAVIGGVDMGEVVVNARVELRYGTLPGSFPAGAAGPIEGIRTIVTDVPRSITDVDNRTVEFTLKKLIVDLRSDQEAPYSKLLTNPSVCSTTQLTANAESYLDTTESMSQGYTVDQCASLVYKNPTASVEASPTTAAANVNLATEISMPAEQPAMRSLVLRLPTGVSFNAPGFGGAADMCAPGTASSNSSANAFDPSTCPDQALVGTAEVETPLLPDPLVGHVYLIDQGSTPNIGMHFSPETGPNNPQGVEIGIRGLSAASEMDPDCAADFTITGFCPVQLRVTFNGLPDAPISAISADIGTVDNREGTTLDGEVLRNVTAGDPNCQPYEDATFTFQSHSLASAHAAAEYPITGCAARSVTIDGAPYGGVTTDTTPELPFMINSGTIYCSVDVHVDGSEECVSPFTPASPLSKGLHRFHAGGSGQESYRSFVVDPPSVIDATAPTTTIEDGPSGPTADTTPDWTFSADETASFQCSVDDGAFLPCETGASPATSGSYEVDVPDAFYAGTSHTFAVRAQDAAGNVGEPVEASISIEIGFAPSLTTSLTTTQARAHPDLDITIDSLSNEDVESVKLGLPDGFFGGLTGVQSLCPLATAAAGNCTVASQVGTVETEARVDESLVRIDGQVYLTDSANFGEPAGLSIKVPAVIQDIDLGDIIVSGRLQVRGQAEGIDSLVVDIPDRITPDNGIDSVTEFDMRQIKLKLRTGAGATHPLLTNPSSCNGSAFTANFTGYDDSASADANGFAATGCEALGFSPNLAMSVVDSTSGQPPVNGSSTKAVSANLTATLSANPGDAGIKDVSILMPRPLTINVLAIPPACTLAQYNNGAGQCPETSRVGSVSAVSPLLPEALTGSVYLLLQNDPARAVPRLLIALRGRINIDIIADNRFENGTQIRTSLTNLPDVPLSAFTLQVDKVLSTRNEACTVPADEWAATGQMAAFNGKSVPVNNQLVFGCKPKYAFTYRKRAKKTLLNVTAVGGPQKMRKLTVRLPKYVAPIKRGLKRKLVITADGKRLSRRCYRVSRKTLTVSLCGKTASTVIVRFRRGSLSAGRKASTTKRLKRLSLWGVDTSKKRIRFTK